MPVNEAVDAADVAALTGPDRSVFWDAATSSVGYVDQHALPRAYVARRAATPDELIAAIATLAIRGAPAIGVAGAYGVALIAATLPPAARPTALAALRAARPTAINLAWAVDRVAAAADPLAAARALHAEQVRIDRAIAERGAALFPAGARVLTHCHTGALATAGEGTALGAILRAHAAGRVARVYVDETRPLYQGARLTLWELGRAGVDARLIVDGAAASVMARGEVDLVIVGADRIAADRAVANKIGTYMLAVCARRHGVPFYVAAPDATFDPACAEGGAMVVEERAAEEVAGAGDARHAAEGRVYNPAFDVTPGELVSAIVTETGLR